MGIGEPDLGEKALSKVAEVGINSQLDEVEELNVDIRTDPLKVIQGEVDSVAIEGKGMVVKQDLRMEKLEINTDSVSINPLSVVFGNIELTQPTNAEAKIVLTESDLNRAVSSDYLSPKLQNLKMDMQGKPATIDFRNTVLHLPGNQEMLLDTELFVHETRETKQVSAHVIPQLKENEQRISLEILNVEGQGLTPELASAILDQLSSLLDLRNFDIPGMTMHLRKFDVQKGQMVLYANTVIREIPSA